VCLSPEISLHEAIKPDLRQVYDIEKKNWFLRTDTPEHAAYDKRTPWLFKEEYSGDGIIALCSKTYYCFEKEDKFSCKGINKRTNQITKDNYMDVLLSKKSGSSTNRGFRSMDNQVFTYFQIYIYSKATLHLSRLVTGSIDRGCINLFFISLSDIFPPNYIHRLYIQCTSNL
jgi:hypothetical protein